MAVFQRKRTMRHRLCGRPSYCATDLYQIFINTAALFDAHKRSARVFRKAGFSRILLGGSMFKPTVFLAVIFHILENRSVNLQSSQMRIAMPEGRIIQLRFTFPPITHTGINLPIKTRQAAIEGCRIRTYPTNVYSSRTPEILG